MARIVHIALKVDDLERASIVRRESNPRDRRSHLIKLTTEGRAKQRRAMKAFDDAANEFFSPLSASERQALAGMLRRLLTPPDHPLKKSSP